jgi:hypothetical protein
MSFSRIATVLGFLVLNACSVGTVTASSDHLPSTPAGGLGAAPAANTPAPVEKTGFDRASLERGSHDKASHTARCRFCD